MAIRNRLGNNRLQTTINVTPLVDVALTLLIVFMLTAPLMQQGLPVNLPEAASPALKRTKKDVVLTVQSSGKIFLGDDKTTIPSMNSAADSAQFFHQNNRRIFS